eukprot:gnl/TRDRNA2_/TRDRNA2_85526_c0_seq1.p1 gnl/TRDRNA2_/TRDRNA2_85526_c0~~gnl/TRDRNA2_/TRDRNA2_85526_c0_seq1.p1  ORF type:complete len:545 (+),score=132.16 gnl/TRDRNA2_/TRDRNA2_85526_c0_seq1:83-1717(+)
MSSATAAPSESATDAPERKSSAGSAFSALEAVKASLAARQASLAARQARQPRPATSGDANDGRQLLTRDIAALQRRECTQRNIDQLKAVVDRCIQHNCGKENQVDKVQQSTTAVDASAAELPSDDGEPLSEQLRSVQTALDLCAQSMQECLEKERNERISLAQKQEEHFEHILNQHVYVLQEQVGSLMSQFGEFFNDGGFRQTVIDRCNELELHLRQEVREVSDSAIEKVTMLGEYVVQLRKEISDVETTSVDRTEQLFTSKWDELAEQLRKEIKDLSREGMDRSNKLISSKCGDLEYQLLKSVSEVLREAAEKNEAAIDRRCNDVEQQLRREINEFFEAGAKNEQLMREDITADAQEAGERHGMLLEALSCLKNDHESGVLHLADVLDKVDSLRLDLDKEREERLTQMSLQVPPVEQLGPFVLQAVEKETAARVALEKKLSSQLAALEGLIADSAKIEELERKSQLVGVKDMYEELRVDMAKMSREASEVRECMMQEIKVLQRPEGDAGTGHAWRTLHGEMTQISSHLQMLQTTVGASPRNTG